MGGWGVRMYHDRSWTRTTFAYSVLFWGGKSLVVRILEQTFSPILFCLFRGNIHGRKHSNTSMKEKWMNEIQ